MPVPASTVQRLKFVDVRNKWFPHVTPDPGPMIVQGVRVSAAVTSDARTVYLIGALVSQFEHDPNRDHAVYIDAYGDSRYTLKDLSEEFRATYSNGELDVLARTLLGPNSYPPLGILAVDILPGLAVRQTGYLAHRLADLLAAGATREDAWVMLGLGTHPTRLSLPGFHALDRTPIYPCR